MSERQPARFATLRVKLRYATIDQFLHKYGPNISRGGVFIATKAPRPVGTPIHFEFVLVNGEVEASVLSGEGVVHFVREADPALPSRAPGMAVKFTKLHHEGQALVERALRMRVAPSEIATTKDMPDGVREMTGEFDLRTGPYPKLPPSEPEPAPAPVDHEATSESSPFDGDIATAVHERVSPLEPAEAPAQAPDVDAKGPDLDALLAECGVLPAHVEEVLHRDPVDASDEALEALRHGTPLEETSAAEAVERLDALLRRR